MTEPQQPEPQTAAARRTERLFRIAILVKGIDGAAELIGSIVLLLVPTVAVQGIIHEVLARDLLGPTDGTLARHFVAGTAEFASGNRTFAVVYLGLHGIVKIALVIALLRKWLPAYPVVVLVLMLFVAYELVRAFHTGSIVLPILAVVDIAIIVMIIREYRMLRARPH